LIALLSLTLGLAGILISIIPFVTNR
jgi:hypothetical protein